MKGTTAKFTERVPVMMTESQYRAFAQCAADDGLSLSSWLRSTGLDRAHRDGKWPVVKETNAA